MDIQVLELEVLRGMERMLSRVEALILECSTFQFLRDQPVVENIIVWLGKRRFSVYDICGFGRRLRDGASPTSTFSSPGMTASYGNPRTGDWDFLSRAHFFSTSSCT